jgi:hypothetical protein
MNNEVNPILSSRVHWMDNLRTVIVFCVVLYHIGGVYEATGLWGWFWIIDDPTTMVWVRIEELLTTFSGIPTSIGGLFLTTDATLASPEPSDSSPGRKLHALPTTRDDSISGSQPNPSLG